MNKHSIACKVSLQFIFFIPSNFNSLLQFMGEMN